MSAFTPAETAACRSLIDMALREDFGTAAGSIEDPTTALCVPPGQDGAAAMVARKAGVVAGLPAAALVFARLDPRVVFDPVAQDGKSVQTGAVLAQVRGPIAAILSGERTALNFLQHLSGIATLTRQYVEAVSGLPVKILDTRKTLPGWRLLAKYAVRQGGGHNHRLGLFDGILIKDNHLAFAQSQFHCGIAVLLAHGRAEALPLEIEVDTLEQLNEALPAMPDIVLLDNMTADQMRAAVQRRDAVAPEVLLEASGGVNLQTVRGIAETGVDRISIGALTHSAPALDIGLDYERSGGA